MEDEVLDDEQEIEVDDVSDNEIDSPEVSVDTMIDKIIGDDNVGAKDEFEALIAAKLNDILDAKRLEISQALYSNDSDAEKDAEKVDDEESVETDTELE